MHFPFHPKCAVVCLEIHSCTLWLGVMDLELAVSLQLALRFPRGGYWLQSVLLFLPRADCQAQCNFSRTVGLNSPPDIVDGITGLTEDEVLDSGTLVTNHSAITILYHQRNFDGQVFVRMSCAYVGCFAFTPHCFQNYT